VTVGRLKRRRWSRWSVRTGGRLAWWTGDGWETEAPAVVLLVGTHRRAIGVVDR